MPAMDFMTANSTQNYQAEDTDKFPDSPVVNLSGDRNEAEESETAQISRFRSASVPISQESRVGKDQEGTLTNGTSVSAPLKLTRSATENAASTMAGRIQASGGFPRTLSKSERKKRDKQMASYLDKIMKGTTLANGAVNITAQSIGSMGLDFFPEDDDHDEIEYNEGVVIPPINICILIVGTRGDVQPFIAIGRRLQEFGHRVRLATHANFRDFVMGEGLEFYPLGGDPKVLAEYMVKNKGFLPSRPADVGIQRKELKAIIHSTWPACTQPDVDSNGLPFVADAIIANPPTMGHTHVAEKLRVPLHVFFTMPWTPTNKWPHPLARVTQVAGFENKLSYYVVDNMIWLGMKDIVNEFRKKTLRLRPITYLGAPKREQLVVPTGYIWSPSLAPKPSDWGKYVDVVGFSFLNLATGYKPPQDLTDFFKAGPPPVYVGFGSLPVQDPKKMTETIVKALKMTNQRGIIQKGWGGLGELSEVPPNIYLLGNCPHDWLFPQCAAVVHHGGAGTTAAGLIAACPTTVVPFFGDQPFWGGCVHEQGVGPEPIPVEQFNLDHLVKAIKYMLQPQVKEAANIMSAKIRSENGVEGAVEVFMKHLPKDTKRGAHNVPWLKKRNWTFGMLMCGTRRGGPLVKE